METYVNRHHVPKLKLDTRILYAIANRNQDMPRTILPPCLPVDDDFPYPCADEHSAEQIQEHKLEVLTHIQSFFLRDYQRRFFAALKPLQDLESTCSDAGLTQRIHLPYHALDMLTVCTKDKSAVVNVVAEPDHWIFYKNGQLLTYINSGIRQCKVLTDIFSIIAKVVGMPYMRQEDVPAPSSPTPAEIEAESPEKKAAWACVDEVYRGSADPPDDGTLNEDLVSSAGVGLSQSSPDVLSDLEEVEEPPAKLANICGLKFRRSLSPQCQNTRLNRMQQFKRMDTVAQKYLYRGFFDGCTDESAASDHDEEPGEEPGDSKENEEAVGTYHSEDEINSQRF